MGQAKKINIKNRTYYLFNDLADIEVFDSKLLKIDKMLYKTLIFITLDTSQLKKLMIMKIFTVEILCN